MCFRVLFGSVFVFLLGCASAGTSTGLPVEFSEKVSAFSDQEVCFSPDEHCDERILTFIGSAQKSIDMAAYELTLKALGDKLTSLAKEIPIKIVVEKKESTRRSSLVSTLVAAGASVRYGHQGGLMHDKFTIVDGNMVETGSFNYTMNAVTRNQENQIYLTKSQVVARYKERFQKMWDAADPITSEK